jgi:2-iminobutanoate/2-iminopropanoate deaminase
MKTFMVVLAAALLFGCRPSDDDIRRIVREEMAAGMAKSYVKPVNVIGPYTPALKVGGFLFVSGQIALDPESGALVNETIEAETRQVLENLGRILRASGYDSSNVVSATVYLKNINDYARMNQIYGGYFPEDKYPARVALEVGALPKQANIEISVIAYK